MLNQLQPLYQTIDRLKKKSELMGHTWLRAMICTVIDTLPYVWKSFLDRLEKQPNHTAVTENQTRRASWSIWKPLWDPIENLLHLTHPSLVLLRALKSLWFWQTRAAVPVVPVVGRGHYYNPILPVHRTKWLPFHQRDQWYPARVFSLTHRKECVWLDEREVY